MDGRPGDHSCPPNPAAYKPCFCWRWKRPTPRRLAILEAECAGDAELRKRVEALLNAHDREGDFLDAVGERGGKTMAAALTTPVIDNRYRLVQVLGEGGMGEVWLAEQREPVRRQVAVKLIKPGMNSKAVLARFDAERQALALMDHPNIAKVLDAGTSETGRPYFVMELVRGIAHRLLRQPPIERGTTPGTVPTDLPGRAARPSKRDHSSRFETDECAGCGN